MEQDRSRVDACPGALQVHQASDGALARVRLPGGVLTPSQMQVLATAAQELSTGELELTSRGNIQLRAVTDPDDLAERLASAGLLPSETHERVRNILASPLAGRVGGRSVSGLVDGLDTALRADPDLAELPGRILFTVDDGRGDVSGLEGDIGVHAVDDKYALLLAGRDTGVRVPHDAAVETMVDAARGFRTARDRHWRVAELPDVGAVLGHTGHVPTAERIDFDVVATAPVGWFDQDDGKVALGAVLAHGVLPSRTAEFLAAVDRPIIVTPWRSIVLVDLDEGAAEQVVRVLAPMGLIFDAESPWVNVSSCVGSSGCAKSHADVRGDLDDAVLNGEVQEGERQHWVGCERRCGRPRGEVTDVVAGPDGYTVTPPA
ncbi:precorrin-3B synthase [Rhodococcoides trifolii]|uniref:Precorrin-3B synthase n=1 Tax=Rhodococcoides trifolii TaxID=908250 RepID=A0A917FXB1_9NOCA|nr:precorrin-3B synthase [Rhodococcus trifolii]GGG10295.1 precorrin-3B synthase [Rhodococcus trifolii]